MDIHIGKLILEKLKEMGMKKSEFARRINKSRQNVQDIFRRQSLDTNLLSDVCKVLHFNIFELLANQQKGLPSSILMEDSPAYKNIKSEKNKQKLHFEDLNKQLKLAQKEVNYLKKINTLLEKRMDKLDKRKK